jgi:RimJ/RimL family protein N-acetyltransferase
MMCKIPIIQTPRLRLRPLDEKDAAAMAKLNADPKVMEFFPAPLTHEENEALLRRLSGILTARGHGLWVVESAEGGDFMGFVGLLAETFEAHFSPFVEVLWRFTPESWGKGYATEAACGVVDFAFAELNLPEIVAYAVPENVRSLGVMKRLGMTHDPSGDFDHPALPERHRLRRHVLYRLARSAWQGTGNS